MPDPATALAPPVPPTASDTPASPSPSLTPAPSASLANPSLPQYRVCSCIGVLPGRACSMCGSMKWLKRCPKCFGSGFFFKNTSQGHPRQEPCGECRRGWKPIPVKDIPQAKKEYEQWLAEQNQAAAHPVGAAAANDKKSKR